MPVHAPSPAGDLHNPGNLPGQGNNTDVHQVIAGFLLMLITPFTEILETFIRKGLLGKTVVWMSYWSLPSSISAFTISSSE